MVVPVADQYHGGSQHKLAFPVADKHHGGSQYEMAFSVAHKYNVVFGIGWPSLWQIESGCKP